ncbi:unnamed protein product, partial [Meganyctiphanes norvegica]
TTSSSAMGRIHPRRLVVYIVGCLLGLLLLLKKGSQQRHYRLFIPNHDPQQVWELLADYSNMPQLNMRIENWELVDETGNFDNWSYKVITYERMMGDVVFGLNVNHIEVTVKPIKAPDHYFMQENCLTYTFRGLIIVNNVGDMHIKSAVENGVQGTEFTETVTMDCPILFGQLCNWESDENRKDFLENLEIWFE